jgi:hypothetical protein
MSISIEGIAGIEKYLDDQGALTQLRLLIQTQSAYPTNLDRHRAACVGR